MRFPFAMLLDFVQTPKTPAEIGDLLTMAGFEVEGIEEVNGDTVLDVKVVSNRGDGLSVLGLAREVLAKDASATPTPLYHRAEGRFASVDQSSAGEAGTMAAVRIETPNCRRYAARVFTDVAHGPIPEWISRRLTQAGMRSISLMVDLSNYVMLEIGQPTHAFDLDTLDGAAIVVRDAQPGEMLVTLDDQERALTEGQMMICDARRPVAVAGVMGGLETEVTPSTKRVLLESANFVNRSVRRTRRALGMSTEASYRFERSVDPELCVAALNRFAELYREATGQSAVAGVIDVYPSPMVPPTMDLRMDRVWTLLGCDVSAEEATGYLRRLGCEVNPEGEVLHVTPPTWRLDLEQEDDLVEEVGRVHGYDRIPEHPIVGTTTVGGLYGFERFVSQVIDAALGQGYIQSMCHSLRSASPLQDPDLAELAPRQPASPEHDRLRSSLLPGLAEVAQRNAGSGLRTFEVGRIFGLSHGQSVERTQLALLAHGAIIPPDRDHRKGEPETFFSVKGALEGTLGFSAAYRPSNDARLHPTRQAEVLLDRTGVGIIGQIHPDLAEALNLPTATILAEVNLDQVFAHRPTPPRYQPVSRHPAVRRDISIAIDRGVPYAEIESLVRDAAGPDLEALELADVFTGAGLQPGAHSLTLSLTLRKANANFTDEEANQVRDAVVAALELRGAQRR